MSTRPVVIDLTYVVTRLHAPTPTGIERVDAAFASHFSAAPDEASAARALHYGLIRPHRLLPRAARRLVDEAAAAWRTAPGGAVDPVLATLARWLREPPRPLAAICGATRKPPSHGLARWRWRLHHDRGADLPHGAIYLNIAQYAFEYPAFFRWLEARPDVVPVFFIHDLLPLDHPEFFRAGYRALFERRVATMARFARAAIVSTTAVADRVTDEMRRRGRDPFPIHVAALPPPALGTGDVAPLEGSAPYFLMVGTIEPRKNHLLLLHLWQSLAARGGAVPRLVLVGPRGWENEQAVDLLDRSTAIRPYVAEVSGLGTAGLSQLIGNARAVLAPSFTEGYGLPLAEALAAGTPAIAADIPVFREVSQGRATLLDPTDGPGWRQAIMDFTDPSSPHRAAAAAEAARYSAPQWPAYFEALDRFLSGL